MNNSSIFEYMMKTSRELNRLMEASKMKHCMIAKEQLNGYSYNSREWDFVMPLQSNYHVLNKDDRSIDG